MADQKLITLYGVSGQAQTGSNPTTITLREGHATPSTIVLYSLPSWVSYTPVIITLKALPVKDVAAPQIVYLFPVSSPAVPSVYDPKLITLYAGHATPSTIVLRPLPNWVVTSPNVIITLRPFSVAVPEAPSGDYYGILKYWTGSTWAKKKLRVYISSTWVEKPVKVRRDGEWKLVNSTGV